MATSATGCFVDEESDYSFKCEYCNEWFSDIDTEGKRVPEIPGSLCLDCYLEYKESLCPAKIKGSSLDTTDYDLLRKE